jgi:hypothetical protein
MYKVYYYTSYLHKLYEIQVSQLQISPAINTCELLHNKDNPL